MADRQLNEAGGLTRGHTALMVIIAVTFYTLGSTKSIILGTFDASKAVSSVVAVSERPASTSSSSFIEEIMPPSLHRLYSPENLRFNVTRSMIRQSRPIVGNTERLHSYLEKLRSQACTSVVFLGGSGKIHHWEPSYAKQKSIWKKRATRLDF